jgi:hypothetical protein
MKEDPDNADLTAALQDAVNLFEQLDIRYAMIGGLAAMLYGTQRHTQDVDFIAASNHEAILAANAQVMQEHHFDPECTWKLYHDSGATIDLWKDQRADEIISRARATELDGRPIMVADPHDLIAMKLRADRPQDDYDISEIVQHTTIDDDLVRQQTDDEQYARYEAIKRRVGM